MKFTVKQEKFINGIVSGKTATQSALDAGYSKNSARYVGAQNLTKLNIKEEIERRRKPIIEEENNKADDMARNIIKELKILAFTDRTEIVKILNEEDTDHQGNKFIIPVIKYKNTDLLTSEQRKCIKAIKPSRNGIVIEFFDKEKAIEMLAKMNGMFEEHEEEKTVNVIINGGNDYAT